MKLNVILVVAVALVTTPKYERQGALELKEESTQHFLN